MSYIENNLNAGEKIDYFNKPSFKPTILYLFIFVPIVFVILWVFEDFIAYLMPNYFMNWHSTIFRVIITIIFTALYLIGNLIEIYVSEYAITNKRVISKRGLIMRNVEEMNLGSIEGVNLIQGILGRIFNYGSIIISGRGTSKVQFLQIDKPVEIRKKIKHKS